MNPVGAIDALTGFCVMPVASWILLSFIVGSATGSADGVVAWGSGAALCLLIAVHLRRQPLLVAAAPLVLGAAAAARATGERWHGAHCQAALVRTTSLTLVTDFDVQAGDAAPARLQQSDGRCPVSAVVAARTSLRGGMWYRTASHPVPAGRGLRLTVHHATSLGTSAWRPSLRADAVRRVDAIFTADAPMARALLLADMHLIPPAMRTHWSRAGLVHLLSVSGVHVAIIASALLMLGSACRLTLPRATALALSVTAAYVVMLGLPPPAVRAAVMFACVLVAKLRQRPASEWSVLILGGALPVVIDPAAPLDLGWQLSVLGVAALAASGRFVRRVGWQGAGRLGALRRECVASIVASMASAPIVAWYFGTVSLIAPLANLLAAPLVTVLQPTLFLALALAPSLAAARFVAGAAHPILLMLDGIAVHASAPAWAALSFAPSLVEAFSASAVVLALLVAMVHRTAGPPLLTAAGAAVVLVWSALWPSRGSGLLELHMLDVGQGDALALRTPHGRWVVIDAGGGAPGIDQGRRVLVPYLRRFGGDVAAFILSHPHLDHVGGAPALIGALQPARYFDGAFAGSTPAYRASLESATVHAVRWNRVHPGDTVQVDGVLLRFLAPDSAWTVQLDDANLASTIVRVEYGAHAMLLVGDAEVPEETWLLDNTPNDWLRADVLKIGHHGSRTSSGAAFLDAVRPSVALVSVGRGNRYGHPSREVLQELARRQITVVRTDLAGTTVVRSDGRSLSMSTAAQTWLLSSPDSVAFSPQRSSPP